MFTLSGRDETFRETYKTYPLLDIAGNARKIKTSSGYEILESIIAVFTRHSKFNSYN